MADFLHLLHLKFEELKDELIVAPPHAVPCLQGEAAILRDVIKRINDGRPSIPKE